MSTSFEGGDSRGHQARLLCRLLEVGLRRDSTGIHNKGETMSEEKNYYQLVTELSYPQYDCTIVKKAANVKAFSLLRFGRTVLMSIFFQNQYHEITLVEEIQDMSLN